MQLRQPTDLVQFITGQVDLLPESTQQEIVNYLSRRYHTRPDSYSYPFRTDIPPRIPFPTAQNPHTQATT